MANEALSAAQMRAVLALLFGPKYVMKAARALQVRESRIRFWASDEQNGSEHASSVSIRNELEGMVRERLAGPYQLVARYEEMIDVADYIDDLVNGADAPPAHSSCA